MAKPAGINLRNRFYCILLLQRVLPNTGFYLTVTITTGMGGVYAIECFTSSNDKTGFTNSGNAERSKGRCHR